jgi:hypothetical protein
MTFPPPHSPPSPHYYFYSTDLCLYFPVTSHFLITRVFSNNVYNNFEEAVTRANC